MLQPHPGSGTGGLAPDSGVWARLPGIRLQSPTVSAGLVIGLLALSLPCLTSPLPCPAYFTSQISDLDSNIYFRVCFWGNSNCRPLQVQDEEGLIQARNTELVTKEVTWRYIQKMLKNKKGKYQGIPGWPPGF